MNKNRIRGGGRGTSGQGHAKSISIKRARRKLRWRRAESGRTYLGRSASCPLRVFRPKADSARRKVRERDEGRSGRDRGVRPVRHQGRQRFCVPSLVLALMTHIALFGAGIQSSPIPNKGGRSGFRADLSTSHRCVTVSLSRLCRSPAPPGIHCLLQATGTAKIEVQRETANRRERRN